MAGLFETWCNHHGGIDAAVLWLNAKLRTRYSPRTAQDWLDGKKLPSNEVLSVIFMDTVAHVIDATEKLGCDEKLFMVSQLSVDTDLPFLLESSRS